MIAEKYQQIRFEAGLAQGQAQRQAQWVAWNQRRLAAEERGERFAEPPPAGGNGQTAQDA